MALLDQALRQTLLFLLAHWFGLFGIVLVLRAVYLRRVHLLSYVPGPFFASITTLWLLGVQSSPRQHWIYVDLHRKYGPVVRISPSRVLINTPNHINDYYGWSKSKWWTAFRGHTTTYSHGQELDVSKHKTAKAEIMGAYTMSQIVKSEHKVDKHISELITQLSDRTGRIIDFALWTQWFALDVVMDVAFTKPLGFVKSATDCDNIIRSLHSLLSIAQVMGIYPQVPALLRRLGMSPRPTDKNGIGAIHGVAYNAVRSRFTDTSVSRNDDILQWLTDNKSLTQLRLEQEAIAPVVAGSDGVANNIRTIILYTVSNPRIYNKLMSQIDAADVAGLLATPPRYEEVSKHVPYLDAIRHEALRILPGAATPFYREVPPQGVTVEGHFLPGGTDVGISHLAIARNSAFFGDDTDVFLPERWTQEYSSEKDEEARRLRDLGDIFFSNGIMKCTGRNLAVLEVMKVCCELFRNFEVQIVNPAKAWEERGSLAMLVWDFWVVLRERQRKEHGAGGA